MANSAPLIDGRTEAILARQVQSLIQSYAWKEFDPDAQLGRALTKIFARYAWLVIQRLNQAPEKNFLTFLDLLGASLLPPEPARVPLTFHLAPGGAVDAVVPARTQVASPPSEGEKEPVIFETERELVVTAAQLVSLFVRDPYSDRYADQSAILADPATPSVPAFAGNPKLEHILYLGYESLLAYPVIKELKLVVNLAKNLPSSADPRWVQWEIWDGVQGISLNPSIDETNNLSRSGTLSFQELPNVPEQQIEGKTNRWLRARLMTPITPSVTKQSGMVRADQLPTIQSLTMQATVERAGLPVDVAFGNLLSVDLSKDFFPFGEKPKFGDVLYLSNDEAFSQAGATITLHLTLTSNISTMPNKGGEPQLTWEFWNGTEWSVLGTSTINEPTTGSFTDTTKAFTIPEVGVFKGDVTFAFPPEINQPTDPKPPSAVTVNGIERHWIRVRLSGGNYGLEAQYVRDPGPPSGYRYDEATFAPPSIEKITVDYSLTKTGVVPDNILTYDDFAHDSPPMPFEPFHATQDSHPTLYLGFTRPPSRSTFPNRTLSLYFRLADVLYGQIADNPTPASPPHLVWEYWNGADWIKLVVNDETDAFTHSGLVEVLPPADFQQRTEFGITRYWLRVRWESGDYKFLPKLCTVLPNTTMATQTVTIINEDLGSSNGSENQIFHTTRTPGLKNQQLQVREPEQPSAEERAWIEDEEGQDAITIVQDAAGRPQEIWVSWHQVPDFYASEPRDRHYVFDHLTGEVRFGDGLSGRIPPIGSGNIRMARYQTGGGLRGNRPARTIVQLKTTVPYIDKVTNIDPASGGAEAETLDSLIARAPRTFRHRGRAVTIEDYEDLAMIASPEIARARCVPLYDLAADPHAAHQLPGVVSLIVVPRSIGPKPLVSLELIDRVQGFLDANRIPTSDLVIVGPDYVAVDIEAEIALTSLDVSSAVEMATNAALTRFLHPLTGGLDGTGWKFGRQPHKSDIYVLLESIPGVDHVRTLNLNIRPDRQDADKTDRFLVYAGTMTITCVFEEG